MGVMFPENEPDHLFSKQYMGDREENWVAITVCSNPELEAEIKYEQEINDFVLSCETKLQKLYRWVNHD